MRPTPNLEDQVSVFISPRDRVDQLYSQVPGSSFRRLLRLEGLLWRYSNPPPYGGYVYDVILTTGCLLICVYKIKSSPELYFKIHKQKQIT
jgi:hypothetical protein